jgi:hypothetical protein
MYECPICKVMPSSHSLSKVMDKGGILYYYTCPSKAIMYNDVQGIINHYNGVLGDIPENKNWVWIFDSLDFGFVHALQTSVAIEVARLISKFSKNLKKIIIINPTMYTTLTHKLVLPFLNHKVKEIIEMNHELKCVDDIFL